MHVPFLPSINNFQVYMKGDVIVDASAAIAPGVILQADPDSRIIIAAGVCIGMGAILHAHQGTLEVQTGAVLGAGVLVIGQGKIGANACIGAATTIWNTSVAPLQVVPPASVLGDTSRSQVETETAVPASAPDEPVTPQASPNLNGQLPSVSESEITASTTPAPPPAEDTPTAPPSDSPPTRIGVTVYGHTHLNQLLLTLFPQKQSAKPSPEDNPSP